MITITVINSIAYYRLAEGRAGLDEHDLGLGYYEDRSGSLGTLLRLVGPTAAGLDPTTSPFAAIRDGDPAQFALVERLGQGRDPRTGRLAIAPVATGRARLGKRGGGAGPQHVVASDLTFSPDKAFSILALLSEPSRRDRLLAIHDAAVEKTLRLAASMGLILNRRGKQGSVRKPAAESIVAVYRHLTSRARDPQLHSHAVLFNMCVRDDGALGAIENRRLLSYKHALSALYRAELARLMRERMGIVAIGKGIGIDIPGVPKSAVELFSKRRSDIVGELNRKGLTSAENRRAAEIAALATRPRKDSTTPLSQLQSNWHEQLNGIGYDIEAIWDQVEAQSERRRNAPNAMPLFNMAARDAYADLHSRELTVSHADILRLEAQTFQTCLAPAQILERAQTRQNELIALPRFSHQMEQFVPAYPIQDEHALLKSALDARGCWTAPSAAAIESVLAGSSASREQRDAVRHMLGSDGVCVAEGAAGTGKTHVLKLLREILVADRRKVLIAAPAWRAARLAGQEARVALADSEALDPLAAAIRDGKRVIDRDTVVIVDEAGMAGSHDLQTLVEAVTAANAKLILTGDTRQLQPVARGAPMRALIALLGSHRLDQIRRQGMDWMREASRLFASGHAAAGLARYAEAGAVAVHADREATLTTCARSYLDDPDRMTSGWTTQALARRLLITIRNEDVAELNRRVRQILITDGQLGADAILFDAMGRGGGHPVALELRAGDRVMFGRRLRLAAEVFNSDVATILAVENDSEDPGIRFQLDRHDDEGRPLVLAARVSELAVRDRAGRDAAIHLQHAYAVTNYAAQGATVDVAVVAHLCAMGEPDLYVACTRHRHSLRVEVDGERILKRTRSRRAGINRAGGFRGTEDEAELAARPLTSEQIARVMDGLQREASARPLKANPSDYVDDVKAWIADADPVAAFRQRMRARSDGPISLPVEAQRVPVGPGPVTVASVEAASVKQVADVRPSVIVPAAGRGIAAVDAEAMSVAERERLASLFSPATCLSWFGGRLFGAHALAHRASGYALDLRSARVGWTRRADQRLRKARAESEPRLVQAAVVFLGHSLRQARNFVRDRAGLWALNPIARALRAKQKAAWRMRVNNLAASAMPVLLAHEDAEVTPSTGLRRFKAMLARKLQLGSGRDLRKDYADITASIGGGEPVAASHRDSLAPATLAPAMPASPSPQIGQTPKARTFGALDPASINPRVLSEAEILGSPRVKDVAPRLTHAQVPAASPEATKPVLPPKANLPSRKVMAAPAATPSSQNPIVSTLPVLDDDERDSLGKRRRKVSIRDGGKLMLEKASGQIETASDSAAARPTPGGVASPDHEIRPAPRARSFRDLDPAAVNPRKLSELEILSKPSVKDAPPALAQAQGAAVFTDRPPVLPQQACAPARTLSAFPAAMPGLENLTGWMLAWLDDDEPESLGKRQRKAVRRDEAAARAERPPSKIETGAGSAAAPIIPGKPASSEKANEIQPPASQSVKGPHTSHVSGIATTRAGERTALGPYRKLDPNTINPRTLLDRDVLAKPSQPAEKRALPRILARRGSAKNSPGDEGPSL